MRPGPIDNDGASLMRNTHDSFPSPEVESELVRIDNQYSHWKSIDDIIKDMGEPTELIFLNAKSGAVQYRFTKTLAYTNLVVIDNGKGDLKVISEPRSES